MEEDGRCTQDTGIAFQDDDEDKNKDDVTIILVNAANYLWLG